MDRKFIAEHCKKCWHCLDVFGLWCAYKGVNVKKMMCSAVERCPYQEEHPEWFARGWHKPTPKVKKGGGDNDDA